jgi:hypothetical protein
MAINLHSSNLNSKQVKKLVSIFLLCVSLHSVGQKVSVDSQGNYRPINKVKPADKATGKMFIDSKGVSYPIYLNSKNMMYILRKSKKTGVEYKSYLKLS